MKHLIHCECGSAPLRAFGAGQFLAVLMALFMGAPTHAFPPAPHHVIYGTVRDEMGNPISLSGATVILESPNGVAITADVVPGIQPGMNYKLAVPIDAGVTSDAYRSSAVRASTLFKLRVRIGRTVYLPIEMSGEFASLGQPAASTRINLTLGEDSNGNGLPDAWERAMIAASNGALTEINPDDDSDKDGLSNLKEYQAGTVAFDDEDGFSLKLVEATSGSASIQFMAIRGRTYSVFASPDMNEWHATPFRGAGDSSDRWSYQATESKVVEVSVSAAPDQAPLRFFKLRVE